MFFFSLFVSFSVPLFLKINFRVPFEGINYTARDKDVMLDEKKNAIKKDRKKGLKIEDEQK